MYGFAPIFIQLINNGTRSAWLRGSEYIFVSAFIKLKHRTSKMWSDPGSGKSGLASPAFLNSPQDSAHDFAAEHGAHAAQEAF